MDFSTIPNTVGLIVAATLAGLVSILTLILTKESKVSDFRQAWIDGLRDDISTLIAQAAAIQNAYALHGHGRLQQQEAIIANAKDDVMPHLVELDMAIARVRLRLNPHEKNSSKMLEVIDKIEGLFSLSSIPSYTSVDDSLNELVKVSQALLKSEWQRVKLGEKAYQNAKGTIKGLLWLGFTALFVIAAYWGIFNVLQHAKLI